MKKVVSIMLMLALAICCLGITTFATDDYHSLEDIQDPRILGFIEALTPFFENPDSWRVLTSDEIDISDSLYYDSFDLYLNHDYQAIYAKWGASLKYVDYLPVVLMEPSHQTQEIESLAASTSRGVSIGNLAFIANAHTNFEFTISMSGNYTVNITEGIISSASNPSLQLVYYQYPTYGNCYIGIITRSASISSDKQSVTFTSRFRCYREYTMGGYDDCGLFQASLIGNTAGTLIGFSPVEYGYPI